jgi:3D (Asp-Asp-Asp) domain-containing protein
MIVLVWIVSLLCAVLWPLSATAESTRPFESDLIPTRNYAASLEVVATGYTAEYACTGKTRAHPQYGVTYSGVKVRRAAYSTIAADLRVFPIGTILYIPGYGYGVVADKGSAVRGRKIDLYFESRRQVFSEWGKRKVRISVIQYGNGRLNERTLDALNGIYAARM